MAIVSGKLIIYIGTLQSGGAERVVSELSSMYADHFKEVTILTYYDMPIFYQIDSRVKVECVERRNGTTNKLQNAFWLRRYVKKQKPDVFLSFLMPFNMMAIASLAFLDTKVVVCERQDPSDVKTPLLRLIRNFLYHFCSRIEVQTTRGRNYFPKLIQRRITVIPNPNHITKEQRDFSLKIPKEKKVAILGRLIPLKNHKMLIESFSRVYRKHPDYKMDIWGDGELYEEIALQIKSLGLEGVITLCGKTNDVPVALSTAQIFVLCSNVEGMPNALMEAVALGIPSIATDVSGVRDIITDGESGFIIPVGNGIALDERLLQLMESDELRNKFSDASNAVLDKFDKDKIFSQWLDLVSFR